MKKFFSLFVIAGVLVLGGVVLFMNHRAEMNKKEFAQKLAEMKQKYSENAQPLRQSGDTETYAREQNALSKKYKDELDKLAKLDESILDTDAAKKAFHETDEKKPPSAEQKKLRDEYFELTKTAFENLTSGQYKPALSQANNGVRIDITSLKRVTTPEGQEALRADFIAWGFPNEVSWGDINMAVWVSKDDPKKKGQKLEEIKYKFDANGAHPIIVIPPNQTDRWVKAFPPSATVGYYYMQLMPRDSEKLDLAMHFKMTSDSGRVTPIDIAFEKLAILEAWMLPPGAKFEATEKEASDNERMGKAEDPQAKK